MLDSLRASLTYANVVSSIALFIVLGGSAYAATQLPRNSVGTKQIKRGAVTSSKVKDRTLTLRDLRRSTIDSLRGAAGPAGPAGPAGEQGPQGIQGTQGATGAAGADAATNVRIRFVDTPVPTNTPNDGTFGTASCNAGERLIGGGAAVTGAAFNDVRFFRNGFGFADPQGSTPTEWRSGVVNPSAADDGTLRTWATCVSP